MGRPVYRIIRFIFLGNRKDLILHGLNSLFAETGFKTTIFF